VLLRAPLFGRPDLYEYACALARAAGGTVTPRASELLPALPRVPERVPELAQPRPIVALHPGGAPHWNRRWPLDRYAGLAVRLARERAASLLVVGGRDERADLERLVAAVRGAEPGARVRETVEPSLNRLANLLAGADLLVGNDSGPAHVAAAVGTPTVVVYGPTGTQFMWARVYPRHLGVSLGGACQRLANVPDDADATPCEHACTRRYLGSSGPYPACLEDIPGDLVLAAAKRALDSAASAGHDPRGR
jgi:ADP-heptose:LPS heptosyltransferase